MDKKYPVAGFIRHQSGKIYPFQISLIG